MQPPYLFICLYASLRTHQASVVPAVGNLEVQVCGIVIRNYRQAVRPGFPVKYLARQPKNVGFARKLHYNVLIGSGSCKLTLERAL